MDGLPSGPRMNTVRRVTTYPYTPQRMCVYVLRVLQVLHIPHACAWPIQASVAGAWYLPKVVGSLFPLVLPFTYFPPPATGWGVVWEGGGRENARALIHSSRLEPATQILPTRSWDIIDAATIEMPVIHSLTQFFVWLRRIGQVECWGYPFSWRYRESFGSAQIFLWETDTEDILLRCVKLT